MVLISGRETFSQSGRKLVNGYPRSRAPAQLFVALQYGKIL